MAAVTGISDSADAGEGAIEMGERRPNPVGAAHATGGASADRRDLLGIARLAHVGVMVDHRVAAAEVAVAVGR